MVLKDYEELGQFLLTLGVTRAFFKPLSENDNSKNQIYFGSSFQVLQQIPFGEITEFPENKDPNYKASINFWWINNSGQSSPAPNTQLILYTRYPEVRLSGFLSNCPTAPREHLQPISREERANNNGKDGRVLILGICPDNKVYGFLALKNSPLAKSILTNLYNDTQGKAIQEFPLNPTLAHCRPISLTFATFWYAPPRFTISVAVESSNRCADCLCQHNHTSLY